MPQAAAYWTKFCSAVLDAVYPPKCALCGILGRLPVCSACAAGFIAVDPAVEWRPEGANLAFRCALFRYEDRAAQAVRRLKYSRATSLAGWMAGEVAAGVSRCGLDPDLIVPVPIHWTRRRIRGFNQAEALCADLRWTPGVLTRVRATRPQVGLSREERTRNLEGAFRASSLAKGRRVMLVDDVLTSGQTGRECAKALLAAGATEVGILAFCGEI